MRIYKIIGYLLLVVGSCGSSYSATTTLEKFVQDRGGNKQQIKEASFPSQYNGCFSTDRYFICINCGFYPNIADNARARYAILQGLNVTIKNMLYKYAMNSATSDIYRNKSVLEQVILSINPSLSKIEFLSASCNNWAGAVSSIKKNDAKKDITDIISNTNFENIYCEFLLSKAKADIASKKYIEAISTIKEIKKFNFSEVECDILAGIAKVEAGNISDAQILANQVWEKMRDQLSADNAEQLGDLFQKLNEKDLAIAAYELASRKLLLSTD